MHKGHGHSFSLAMRLGHQSKTIKILLMPGNIDGADYWVKHHSPSHHRQIRDEILTPYQVVMDLRSKMAKLR